MFYLLSYGIIPYLRYTNIHETRGVEIYLCNINLYSFNFVVMRKVYQLKRATFFHITQQVSKLQERRLFA